MTARQAVVACAEGGHVWDHCSRCGYWRDTPSDRYVVVVVHEQRVMGPFGSNREAQAWIGAADSRSTGRSGWNARSESSESARAARSARAPPTGPLSAAGGPARPVRAGPVS
jgi:hypothetical protein